MATTPTTTQDHLALAKWFLSKNYTTSNVWAYLKPKGYVVATSGGNKRFDIGAVLCIMDLLRTGILVENVQAEKPTKTRARKPRA